MRRLAAFSLLILCSSPALRPAVAQQQAEADALVAPQAELLGVWRLVSTPATEAVNEDTWVEITPRFWVVAAGGKLQYRSPILGRRGDELVIVFFGNRQARRLEVDGSDMTVTFTQTRSRFNPEPKTITETYRRSTERPQALTLSEVPLAERHESLSTERIAGIREKLVARAKRDQEAREIFTRPGAKPTAEDQMRMHDTDADNTSYLLGLIADVGWIDAETFGEEAADNAWLIVQHTRDLGLKWTVLQELEREIQKRGAGDGDFALLWDRTRIWLGHKQRYGSQIFHGPDGMFMPPIEEPEAVDERRARLGMEPLADYLARFRERNGGRAVPVLSEY